MPALEVAQVAQVAAMREALRAHLGRRGGWISFDEYLEQVLYAPALGYYSAGAAKFGRAGDFTTAPEISPMFGACIARQCASLTREGGELLELGAGSGALAEALLLRLAADGALPAQYLILEVSADLRERQRARLSCLSPALYKRVRWLDAPPRRPLRGVILANEVADALPFQCFEANGNGYEERGVGMDDQGRLGWAARPAAPALCAELARLEESIARPFASGYRSELCMRVGPWIASLAAALEVGGVLLFDYGLGRQELYHPQRHAGTLRCHYRHRAHEDPFLHPGLQDISAWVDFTRVAEAASAAGLEVAGYCTQAAFLLGAGIEAELLTEGNAFERARSATLARALLMPAQMGETFKVMLLTRGTVPKLTAFGVQDLRRML